MEGTPFPCSYLHQILHPGLACLVLAAANRSNKRLERLQGTFEAQLQWRLLCAPLAPSRPAPSPAPAYPGLALQVGTHKFQGSIDRRL